MSSILKRLEANRQKNATANVGVADQLYSSMMADIKAKAVSDARMMIQAELDIAQAGILKAQAETKAVEAERDAAKTLYESASTLVQDLKGQVSKLKADIQEKTRALAMSKQELNDGSQVLKSELSQERLKVKDLEIQVANLTGKLSEKKNYKPAPVVAPMQIPSFDVKPVRGMDGRITGATVTPIRTN